MRGQALCLNAVASEFKPFRLAGACVLDNDGHRTLERALSAAGTGKILLKLSAMGTFCDPRATRVSVGRGVNARMS